MALLFRKATTTARRLRRGIRLAGGLHRPLLPALAADPAAVRPCFNACGPTGWDSKHAHRLHHPEFVTEPYFSGGLANYINRIGTVLAERGHDIHILTRARRDETFVHRPGVQVHRLALADPGDLAPMAFPQAPDLEAWLRFSSAAATKIAALPRERPLDIVQASNSRACGLFTMLRTPLPVVTRLIFLAYPDPCGTPACRISSQAPTSRGGSGGFVSAKLCRGYHLPEPGTCPVLPRGRLAWMPA